MNFPNTALPAFLETARHITGQAIAARLVPELLR
jgi:hypothetical protein